MKTAVNRPPLILKWLGKSDSLYFRLLQKIASNSVEILEGIGSQFSQRLSNKYCQPSWLIINQFTFHTHLCLFCLLSWRHPVHTVKLTERPSLLAILFYASCNQHSNMAFIQQWTNTNSFLFQRRRGKSGGEGLRLLVLVGFEADVMHLNYLWPRFWDVSEKLPESLSLCVQIRLLIYSSDFLFYLPLVSFNDCVLNAMYCCLVDIALYCTVS